MEVTYLSDEHERLSKDVEVLFRQATSRFAVPTASGCAMVAFYLLGLRDTPQKQTNNPRRSDTASSFCTTFRPNGGRWSIGSRYIPKDNR